MALADWTRLIEQIQPHPGGEEPIKFRTGVVDTVNADGTVDVILSGIVIPDVPVLNGLIPGASEVVWLHTWRGSMYVLGSPATTNAGFQQRIATTIVSSDSSAFTAETVVMTIVAPLVIGRRYAIWAFPKFASTVDNDDVQANLRQDNVSGTTLQVDLRELTADNQEGVGQTFTLYAEYTATATGNKTFVVTGQRNAGTGDIRLESNTGRESYAFVEYISG